MTMIIASRICLLATLLSGAAPALAEPTRTALQPDDLFALKLVRDPQISPDGGRVAYVLETADAATDKRATSVWVRSVARGAARQLSQASAMHPRWSRDGTKLAWIEQNAAGAALRIWSVSGQRDVRIAAAPQPILGFAWSPDGGRLAYARLVPEAEPSLGKVVRPPAGARWNPPPRVVDRLLWRTDAGGPNPAGTVRVHLVAVQGSKPLVLGTGAFDEGGEGLSWADSKTILFAANPNRGFAALKGFNASRIFAVPADGGATAMLPRPRETDGAADSSPAGCEGAVAFLRRAEPNRHHSPSRLILVRPGAGTESTLAPHLDRDVESPFWSADCQHLMALVTDSGRTRLMRFGLDGGVEELASDVGTSLTAYAWGGGASSAATGAFVFNITRPDLPSALAFLAAGGTTPKILFDPNQELLERRTLPRVEELNLVAPDKLPIQGWLIHPTARPGNAKGPVALVLDIHGGPLGDYGWRFDLEKMLLAARGYAVLYINPRGSSGYGTDFANRIHQDFPGKDAGDLLAAVDHVVNSGAVDPARIYVMGLSSGGTMAAWLTAHDRRFRAAALLYPAINWESMITTDIMPYIPLTGFPGAPWEVPERYRRYSPLAHVDRVTTPTLLITGEQDFRTPMSETEQYFAALQWRGVASAMVRVPGENHGIRRFPSSVLHKIEMLDAWFRRHGSVAD